MEEASNKVHDSASFKTACELAFGEMRKFDQEDVSEKGKSEPDRIVVDIGSLPNCDSDITGKQKSTFQRSFSRKGSQPAERNHINVVADNGVAKSPQAVLLGDCSGDMSIVVEIPLSGTVDHLSKPQTQTLVANDADSSCRWRKSGRQRSSYTDPWQILFFFATLSSVGTIVLIYFTLSMGKLKGE